MSATEMSQSNVRKRKTSPKVRPIKATLSKNGSSKFIRPDHPIHKAQDSLFSSSSGWTNCQGVFNLLILLFVIASACLALDNFFKYGLLISPYGWFNIELVDLNVWPMVTLIVWSNISILLALFAEKLLASGIVGNRFAGSFYVALIIAHFTIPALKILNYDGNPLFSVWSLTIIVVEGLKLISYGHVNYWCRCARETKKNEKTATPTSYPNNLTVSNMYYFMLAPTLCYELHFPKTPVRRKSFIFKRVVELIALSFLIVALSQQWVIPLVMNSIAPFSELDFTRFVECVLKLAIPNHLLWLLGFYTMFHSALNLMAELLRFADRKFYLDFWNSETITYFWRSWNIPVHRWAVRHLYKPIVNSGYSKLTASVIVFFVSAFFHEYLVSVPLHMFRLWAFNGMLAQIPLSLIIDRFLHGRSGNIAVWLSIVLGQPMVILMYAHDWYWLTHPEHGQVTINAAVPHIRDRFFTFTLAFLKFLLVSLNTT